MHDLRRRRIAGRDVNGQREVLKIGKALGNVVEPMDVITKFSSEAFRYYFLRECPFPSDGEFSWGQFEVRYNGDLVGARESDHEPTSSGAGTRWAMVSSHDVRPCAVR